MSSSAASSSSPLVDSPSSVDHLRDVDPLPLDIIIPTYRVQMSFLRNLLTLKASTGCKVQYYVIVDNPESPSAPELREFLRGRTDVTLIVNERNLGASAARNVGIRAATSKWLFFLDDDVVAEDDILIQAEIAIRSNPDAAGFVGDTRFHVADTIFTTAVHLSGVTCFWGTKCGRGRDNIMAWGVTANLICRKYETESPEFDCRFPKTGGGEDIDFCLNVKKASVKRGGRSFLAAPKMVATHPYWNEGERSYWRFYMWSKGDSWLLSMHPDICYRDYVPNGAEMILFMTLLFVALIPLTFLSLDMKPLMYPLSGLLAVLISNILHDIIRYLTGRQSLHFKTSLSGLSYVAAVAESSLIRLSNEGGRTMALVQRGEFNSLMKRVDWFTGLDAMALKIEDKNAKERLAGAAILWAGLVLALF